MIAQHTPGPWSYSADPNDYAFEHVQNERGAIVAKPMRMGGNGAMEANARLIAAAPELLAALGKTLDRLESALEHVTRTVADDQAIDMARRAIAKAEGRS